MSGQTVGVVVETELTLFRRGQQLSSPFLVGGLHHDPHHAEAVQREPVSVSQRLSPQFTRDAGRGEERANLLRLDLAVRHEDASFGSHTSPAPRSVSRRACHLVQPFLDDGGDFLVVLLQHQHVSISPDADVGEPDEP